MKWLPKLRRVHARLDGVSGVVELRVNFTLSHKKFIGFGGKFH